MTTSSPGSYSAARYFSSRAFLDRELPPSPRVLPRAGDYFRAAVPLPLWRNVWTGIQARARVDVARLNNGKAVAR